ncbi:MAG: hypothetical protein HKL85_10305 [Acidimicrobiaceae bacterium]|nr:hypothetical protein [Acidimicrobiaceae bacterium]
MRKLVAARRLAAPECNGPVSGADHVINEGGYVVVAKSGRTLELVRINPVTTSAAWSYAWNIASLRSGLVMAAPGGIVRSWVMPRHAPPSSKPDLRVSVRPGGDSVVVAPIKEMRVARESLAGEA